MGLSHSKQKGRGSGDKESKVAESEPSDEMAMEICITRTSTVEGDNQGQVWNGEQMDYLPHNFMGL